MDTEESQCPQPLQSLDKAAAVTHVRSHVNGGSGSFFTSCNAAPHKPKSTKFSTQQHWLVFQIVLHINSSLQSSVAHCLRKGSKYKALDTQFNLTHPFISYGPEHQ